MWQDPTDVTKRKPRRLRGTPANKFTGLITFGVIGAFCSICLWYTNSEAKWVQRAKKRVVERVKPKETESIRKEMFMDSALAAVINTVNERKLQRELDEIEAGKK